QLYYTDVHNTSAIMQASARISHSATPPLTLAQWHSGRREAASRCSPRVYVEKALCHGGGWVLAQWHSTYSGPPPVGGPRLDPRCLRDGRKCPSRRPARLIARKSSCSGS